MREHRELTNKPRLLVANGSQISIDEVDTTAGQIIWHNPMAGPVKFLEIPSMANYTYQELERMPAFIRDQAAVTEQDTGATSSDNSGRYAAIMEAQSDQQVGPVLKYNAPEWIEVGRGMLLLTQSRYTDNRTWTVTGEDKPMTYWFRDMNLRPGWDIDIQEEDAMSSNKAVRLNQVIELNNSTGLYLDETTGQLDKKAFAKAAQLKVVGQGQDNREADRTRAAAIPGLIANEQPYEPKMWDNPDIFAEELETWLKGPGSSPEADENIVQQVAGLYQFYLLRSTAYLQQQQAMGAAAPPASGSASTGGPGGGGVAPPQAPNVTSEAEQNVEAADDAAEASSAVQQNHEG
jgi:hypothetical protein